MGFFVRHLKKDRFASLGLVLLMVAFASGTFASLDNTSNPANNNSKRVGPVRPALAQLNKMNRVHRRSNIWMNMTNYGYFGNSSRRDRNALDDPCLPGIWASQCEYPGGSDVQYLFQGSLWLGALIRAEGFEYPRVSVGTDGWLNPGVHEFQPGEGETNTLQNGMIERSTLPLDFDCLGNFIGAYHDSAVSEQDFVCSYTDTLTESFYVREDPIDGPHIPLGIKITQKSYAWTYNYAQNFIIIDWEIENIAGNYLKNLYVGLYIDADVGAESEGEWHEDDVCGFQRMYYYVRPDGQPDSSVINTAWIADNDGRPDDVTSGTAFTAPAVTGTRVVRAPNPELETSFNWWISNGDTDLDFGPALEEDGAPGGWTNTFGTPMGDVRKYFLLSNGEFDYDQVYVDNRDNYVVNNPFRIIDPWTGEILEEHPWKIPGETDDTPERVVDDLSNGYDTRYLISWGPLGIFDHINEAGDRIYRLNPGERFSMTIAYVAGDNFHDRNNPQPDASFIEPDLFDFKSLRYNADWAAKVYDNPMLDTPIEDTDGDGVLDTGDGWYGEDVGTDGLYSPDPENIPNAYVWDEQGRVVDTPRYPGKDADGSEMDGHLQREEDDLNRPLYLDYTRRNNKLDLGDGHPDFKGPPPPQSPDLQIVTDPVVIHVTADSVHVITQEFLENNIVLRWNKDPSEMSKDPFSQELDFEGYRVYISNSFLERDFAFVDQFDIVDYSYYSESDSLARKPIKTTAPDTLPQVITDSGVQLYLKKVGANTGFTNHEQMIPDTAGNYYYIVKDAHPMIPRYYAVTAYDYGDYKSGTEPLESAKIANARYVAPTGNSSKKVMVVPNPYRADQDYTVRHGGLRGLAWENRDDGTFDFYPQQDRRIYFYNLPRKCLIRIYTVAGDLVNILEHDADNKQGLVSEFATFWKLNSRNKLQVVAGLYLFTVEDLTPANKGNIEVGKFVIIR